MVTFFIMLGILILVVKLIFFAIKMAWGISKIVFYIIGIPLILVGLLLAGLVQVVIPLLLIVLAVSFIWPLIKNI